MNNTEEIIEIKFKDFNMVESIIYESKFIDEQLFNQQNAIEFIQNKMKRNKAKIFVKKKNGIVAAFLVLYHKVNSLSLINYNWHISYLYVKPEYRRNHFAKQIMKKCIDFAIMTRVNHISLNTDTENYAAQKLYEELGFEKMPFIANYYYYELKLQSELKI